MHFRGASDGAEFGKTRILAILSNERQPLSDIAPNHPRGQRLQKLAGWAIRIERT